MLLLLLILFLDGSSATDYCKLCNGNHTMCIYKKGPATSCVGYTKVDLSPETKKYIVNVHNDIRNHVASGQEYRGTLGGQPPASNMFPLDWDDELAEIAQRWVDRCVLLEDKNQHDACKKTDRFDIGQNILTAVTVEPQPPEIAVLILNWYKQVLNVIPSDVDNFVGIRKGRQTIGQYSQLVWAKTKYVGCAMARYENPNSDKAAPKQYLHRFVCNYGPTGNVLGQSIYEKGVPCTKCPDMKCDPIRGNLCLNPAESKISKYLSDVIDKQLFKKLEKINGFGNNDMFENLVDDSYYCNPDVDAKNNFTFKPRAVLMASTERTILQTAETTTFITRLPLVKDPRVLRAAVKEKSKRGFVNVLVPEDKSINILLRDDGGGGGGEKVTAQGFMVGGNCRCNYPYRSNAVAKTVSWLVFLFCLLHINIE